MLQQRNLSPDMLGSIFQQIKTRRIEPTSEASGCAKQEHLSVNLQDLCISALVSRVDAASLGFSTSCLPGDLRLRIFAELSKPSGFMGDHVIELLKDTNVKFVRINRSVTDDGLRLLAQYCPQLERAYLRPNEMTLRGLITVLEQCRGLTWLDIGWTHVFDKASEDEIRRFFEVLPPTLTYLSIRGTGSRWLDLRANLISKHCLNLRDINLGRIKKISCQHISQILSSCTSIQTLTIDRLQLTDADIEVVVKLCGNNLKLLDIGDTLCTDRGLGVIAEMCPNLENLVLRNLPLMDSGLMAISQKVKNMRSIDLGGCYEVTDTAITELAKLSNLEEVNLEGVIHLTETSIKLLVAECKKLRKFEIPENELISRAYRASVIKGKEWRRNAQQPNVVYYA